MTLIIPRNMKILVKERIHDSRLRLNLKRAMTTSLVKRNRVVAEFPEWEAMRDKAHDIKTNVISNLAMYLDRFEKNAEAAGAKVWYAGTGEEASEIIIAISKRFNGRVAVKSKSMTSEEIGLGEALLNAGLEPIETDLGEYIVQLAHEIPSHITGPAVHKSREEIGALFAEKLGIPYTSEPAELTLIARKVLREKFLTAEVGISGVNFAVADTGAIVIVENEGNARMSTTLPKVHIALMGIEKIVPDTNSLTLFLNMLARSATGQRISSYTNIIRGPKKTADHDGPEELHIVILDNGRTNMLAEPGLRDALLCIRCGACLNVCPVYQKIGGHGYGSIYPGPIGSVISPMFFGAEEAKQLPFASSLCGACAEICPVKIDLHHRLLWWRKTIVNRGYNSPIERLIMKAFAFTMTHPGLYALGARLARIFSPLLATSETSLKVPVWSRSKDFPRFAEKTFKELWKEEGNERA